MNEPRFRIGDQVRWTTGPHPQSTGAIQDGPFEPGVQRHYPGCLPLQEFAYLVAFAERRVVKLLGETVLEPIIPWVPCPGEHRKTEKGWERQWIHSDYEGCEARATHQWHKSCAVTIYACPQHNAAFLTGTTWPPIT